MIRSLFAVVLSLTVVPTALAQDGSDAAEDEPSLATSPDDGADPQLAPEDPDSVDGADNADGAAPVPEETAKDTLSPAQKKYMQATVKMEIDALSGLINAMKSVMEKKGKKATDAAKQSHKAGAALYEEAQSLASADDYEGAYLKLKEAWQTHEAANEFFIQRAPKDALAQITVKLLDLLSDRITEIEEHIDKAPEAARTPFAEARENYQTAKTLHSNKDDREAFRSANDAVHSLHKALVITWKMAT